MRALTDRAGGEQGRQGRGPQLDLEAIRAEFPVLDVRPRGRELVYLDNAATTQKPRRVIERVSQYYSHENANIHRGLHYLSEQATANYEGVRGRVRDWIGAASADEVVFTRGTTESINLVASAFCRRRLSPGDEILISGMEHHSNIVPWQMVCEETGARLRVVPLNDRGEAELEDFEKLLGPATRFVSVVHASNALGTVNPVAEIVARAHEVGATVMIDGAQAAAHLPVDVQQLGCDFYAFSSHKLYGPTGVGVLYGKAELLEAMSPYQGGGEMISTVTFEGSTYKKAPHKFEAGTPNIAGVIGLGAALDFLAEIGLEAAAQHEAELLQYATEQLQEFPGVRLLGTAEQKVCILSFFMDAAHPHDISTILDTEGVAIRAGHHCAQPVMERYGVAATARASFALYNTRDEVDSLVSALRKVDEVFR